MPSFSDLIKIGNRAKGIGQWEAANLAFGLALKDYFDFLFMGGEGEVPRIHIETGDTIGSNSGEVFYDLLTIETREAGSLCIPVPLLNPFAAFCAAKTARLVTRGEHSGRQVREDIPAEETEELWKQLLGFFPEDVVLQEVLSDILNLD